MALTYRTITKGTVNFASGDLTATVTLGAAITLNRSVLFHSARAASTQIGRMMIRGDITDTTTLTFTRETSGATATVEYALVEVAAGWTVQRGTTALAGVTSNTATISSVTTSRTWTLISLSTASAATDMDRQNLVRGVLTNATTLTFTKANATTTVNVSWQAITFDADADGTVQRGQSTIAGAGSSVVPTLSAVNLARSFARGSGTHNESTGVLADAFLSFELTSTTALTIARAGTGATGVIVEWEVVEFGADSAVQSVAVSLADTDGSDADTITSVNTDNSFVLIPHSQNYGRNNSVGSTAQNAVITSALTNATTITTTRDGTGGQLDATLYVVTLSPDSAPPPTITVQPANDVGIISNGQSTVYTTTATGTTISALTWSEDGSPIADGGIYDIVTTGIGTGSVTSTLTITRTSKTGTPFDIKANVVDANGNTDTNTVTDTWWTGPVLTTFPATNGSGVSTATLTCDYVTGVGEAIEVRIPLSDGDVAVTVTTT